MRSLLLRSPLVLFGGLLFLGACGRIGYAVLRVDATVDQYSGLTDSSLMDSGVLNGAADSSVDTSAALDAAPDRPAIDADPRDQQTANRDASLDARAVDATEDAASQSDMGPRDAVLDGPLGASDSTLPIGCTPAAPGTIVSVRPRQELGFLIVSVTFPFADTDGFVSFSSRSEVSTFRVLERDFVVASGNGLVGRYGRDGTERWAREGPGIIRAVSEPNLGGDILVWTGNQSLERWSKDDGRTLWSTRSPEAGSGLTSPPHYTVSSSGIYVGYDFDTPMTIGGVVHNPTSAARDVLVAKYGFDGAHQWTRSWPTQSTWSPTLGGMANDGSGARAFIMRGTAPFNFGTGNVSPGPWGFSVQLDETGTVQQARGEAGLFEVRLRDGYITRDASRLRRFSDTGTLLWTLSGGSSRLSACLEIDDELVCSAEVSGAVSLGGAPVRGPDLVVLGLDSVTGLARWTSQLNVQSLVVGSGIVPRFEDACRRVSAQATMGAPYSPMGTLLDPADGGFHTVDLVIQR